MVGLGCDISTCASCFLSNVLAYMYICFYSRLLISLYMIVFIYLHFILVFSSLPDRLIRSRLTERHC
jgi:hypothetical protein